MPFIQRIIEPKYLSRTTLHNENGAPLITDCELDAVSNNTLSNALRQLASLVLIANDIFTELTKELEKVSQRSSSLKVKIGIVEEKVSVYDPKKVPVPEGDISTFALLRNHYAKPQPLNTELFSAATRPTALQALYEAAAKTPVHVMRQMDRWRRDGHRSSRFFLCTPVLGAKRRKIRNKIDIDIETRMPAAVEELRRWTSSEAIGDVTVTTDCINRIATNTTVPEVDATDTGATSGDDEGLDHKLPSPEEQLQVLALKFPAEVVAVDVSGRRFDRMSVQRRSLLHGETTYEEEETDGSTIRRRTRSRKPRGKRRNTLAGTDQKEIRDALTAGDEATSSIQLDEPISPESGAVIRSRSTDILRSKKGSPPDGKKSHFNSLKQWGKNRFKMMSKSSDSKSTLDANKVDEPEDANIYETVTMRRRKNVDKETKPTHERKTSYSSSDKSSNISLPISTPLSAALNIAVKLRESSAQRRQRRNKDEQHSSSGNWSASSESGRASIGSEITSTTHPKSTTSATTSSNSLNQHGAPSSINSRRRFVNTSTSSSVTSEGTLTPDIIHDMHDDGETSSVYSCDTEGYYTSFHMDSGLKTLKEEELGLPMTPLHSTNAFSNSSSNCTVLTAENEYELFGKGSTSTTTSSAGTVCTTLMAADSNRSLLVGPAVPERKSSLGNARNVDRSGNSSLEREFGSEKTGTVKRSPASSNKATVVAVVHKQSGGGDVSPDSGHNTSSSPIESVSSPNGVPSGSEFEFSESSDLEGVERIERIRIKTTINSSRIPSMCVITPPHSDDESVKSMQHFEYPVAQTNDKNETSSDKLSQNNLNIPDLGSKNTSRPKLNLPLQLEETDLDTLTFADSASNNCDELQKGRVIITPVNGSNKMQLINVNPTSGYATVETIQSQINTNEVNSDATQPNVNSIRSVRAPSPSGGSVTVKETVSEIKPPNHQQPIIKATLLPLNNMFGKLKSNFSQFSTKKEKTALKETDDMFDSGDYVTIADVRNNNGKAPIATEVHYANDIVKKNETRVRETEYVSLNELPVGSKDNYCAGTDTGTESGNSLERCRRQGARVTLDAEGKVVYSSDSLRRRKGAHTTFEPGPFVKDTTSPTASPLAVHRVPKAVRPVGNSQDVHRAVNGGATTSRVPSDPDPRPLSPQLSKFVIRANPKTSSGVTSPTADYVRMPPATIVTPTMRPMSPKLPGTRGAYVHMQEDRGRSLSPAHEEERAPSSYKSQPIQPQITDCHNKKNSPMAYEQRIVCNDDYVFQRTPLYNTLPSRSFYHGAHAGRSLTPDINRGTATQNPSSPHDEIYDTRNYRFSSLPRRHVMQKSEFEYNVNSELIPNFPQQVRAVSVPQVPNFTKQTQVPFNAEINPRYVQNFHSSTPTKTDFNSAASKMSMGITHFFSPIKKVTEPQSNLEESLKISPIDPRNTGSFKSSTPHIKDVNSAININKKLLSPKKSTMSNDELYAMIHKGKKKLNIKTEDVEGCSPASSVSNLSLSGRSTPVKQPETGYLGDGKSRNSWSPNNDECNTFNAEVGSRQSWACSDRLGPKQTSRLDFKKLLLQHGSKSNILPTTGNKLSAVEQLKLSKNQQPVAKQTPTINILELSASPRSLLNRKHANPSPGSPKNSAEKQRPVSKLLSPRSNWRFANPRSDVLSSTILEDCREDESSNSSNERKSTRSSPVLQDNKNCVQDSIARSNTCVVADNGKHTLGFRRQLSNELNHVSNGLQNMNRSQYLQAQRAEFFKSPSGYGVSNLGTTFIKKEGSQNCPSPPTLETAL